MDHLESQNSRDARVEALWRQLDPDGKGELDLPGLRRGLKRMDHRQSSFVTACPTSLKLTSILALKNAHGFLEDVMKAVDSSGDGKIQFEGTQSIELVVAKHILMRDKSSANLSNTPKQSCYLYFNPLTETTMVKSINQSFRLLSRALALHSLEKNLISSLQRLILIRMARLVLMNGGKIDYSLSVKN